MYVAKYLNVYVLRGVILCFGELCVADNILGLDLGVQAGNSNSKSAPVGKSHQNMQVKNSRLDGHICQLYFLLHMFLLSCPFFPPFFPLYFSHSVWEELCEFEEILF